MSGVICAIYRVESKREDGYSVTSFLADIITSSVRLH